MILQAVVVIVTMLLYNKIMLSPDDGPVAKGIIQGLLIAGAFSLWRACNYPYLWFKAEYEANRFINRSEAVRMLIEDIKPLNRTISQTAVVYRKTSPNGKRKQRRRVIHSFN